VLLSDCILFWAVESALQSKVSCNNVEWDELKVHDTVICTRYTSSGTCPPRETSRDSGRRSISDCWVRDFWTAIEYGGVSEFLGMLRNRGHRLIARWGEEILLEPSANRKRGI